MLMCATKGIANEFELIILHPHFLPHRRYLPIQNPTTGQNANYYSGDGCLHQESPTGPLLPPFRSRGIVAREIPLNPILVTFPAHLRMRRLDRMTPRWRARLHPHAQKLLTVLGELYDAVTWRPGPVFMECVEIQRS